MKEKNYSKTIANAIKNFLEEDEWKFSFEEAKGLFKFGLSLKSKLKNISYIVTVKEDDYIVYAVSPIGADEDDGKMMATMADFICRANYGLKSGNFELDTDGEIRLKCYVDCDGIIPTREMIENSIHRPAAMFKRYGSGIADIIFKSITAKDAIEQCKKTIEDELRTFLSEIASVEEGEEGGDILARLTERLGSSDEHVSSDDDSIPKEIKTDLFGTEGGED